MALAALSLSLAACGDELADFRKNELRPLEKRAEQQRGLLSATLENVQMGDEQDAQLLTQQLVPLEQTFAELAKLDPPDDYEDTYDKYVEANAHLVAELKRFIAALRASDRRELRRASEQAREAIGDGINAIQPLHE